MQPNKAASTSAPPCCFKCVELGHRMVQRVTNAGGALRGCALSLGCQRIMPFGDIEKGIEFDAKEEIEEELVPRDDRPLLVVRRACFTPCKVEGKIGGITTSSNLLVPLVVRCADL